MAIEHLEIPGAWKFTPKQWADDRGVFFEWFQNDTFISASGIKLDLAQANCSISKKGTLRGIHFADVPPGQRKYVTCFSGSAIDVIVDLRLGSPMFGKWIAIELNTQERSVISIPNGVGHAFVALEDNTTIVYLCDQRYNPTGEREIYPLDSDIGIQWPHDLEILLSPKDESAPKLAEIMASLPKFEAIQ